MKEDERGKLMTFLKENQLLHCISVKYKRTDAQVRITISHFYNLALHYCYGQPEIAMSAFYRHLHKFFGSPQHLQSLQSISGAPKAQKLSTKLMRWLAYQEIKQKADKIRADQASTATQGPS